MAIEVKRVYEAASAADGCRILVDRLWPRGRSKETAKIDLWAKDVAPSSELRKWFGHDPQRWDEFVERYFAELDRVPEVWRPLLDRVRRGPVTFLYATKDAEHNNAVALQQYLEAKMEPKES